MLEMNNSGKKTSRDDINRSIRKIIENKTNDTERMFRETNNQSRKSIIFKKEKNCTEIAEPKEKSISIPYP